MNGNLVACGDRSKKICKETFLHSKIQRGRIRLRISPKGKFKCLFEHSSRCLLPSFNDSEFDMTDGLDISGIAP